MGPEIKLQADLAPVKATHHDLFSIIAQTRTLVGTANADFDNKYSSESLTLRDDRLTLRLSDGFPQDDLAGAPEVTYDVYYDYQNSKAPISRVTLRLADRSREVSISGHSREQVEALHGLLAQQFGNHATFMGGFGFRVLGFLALNIIAWVVFSAGIWLRSRTVRISCWVVAPLIFVSIWILPWRAWFPGTAIYPDSASFIVRHSSAISLAGVVLTMLTFAVALGYSTYLARTAPNEGEPQEQLAESSPNSPVQVDTAGEPRKLSKRSRKKGGK